MSSTETVPPMKIRSIAPWFGGKRTLETDIIAELGPHKAYFEPFCGSMAVLLAKPSTNLETVNDLHGGLICLARVLADRLQAERLYERLSRTLFHESLLDDAQAYIGDRGNDPPWPGLETDHGAHPQLCRASDVMGDYAYWYFIASWMARNGTAGTERINYQPAVRWSPNGGSPTIRFNSAIESIPPWHHRIKNVVILLRDAFDIIPKFQDAATTAIYVDSPYYHGSRTGIHDASCRYLHDFAIPAAEKSLFDRKPKELPPHKRLAEQLREFKHARIVISYYDCPEVRSLYPGWTIVNKTMRKNLTQMGGLGASESSAPEILLINGRSFTG